MSTLTTDAPALPSLSASLLSTVPKLTGDNYYDWKFAISMVLRHAGCWNIIKEGKEGRPRTRSAGDAWGAKADQALTIIGLTIDPSQYVYIRDSKDGVEAWEALAAIHTKNTCATRIALKRQFYGFRHAMDAPMRNYISGITNLAARLKGIGVTLDDSDITDVLIFNLGEEYTNITSGDR